MEKEKASVEMLDEMVREIISGKGKKVALAEQLHALTESEIR